MSDVALAADFPAATRELWLAAVGKVLKGADFEKKLVSRTYDGLRVEPLYAAAEPAPQPGRAQPGPWRVAQRVDHPEPAQAAIQAREDLEGGADSLTLVLAGAPAARGFGLKAATVADLDRALEGVMLDLIHVRLDAGCAGRQAAALLVALAERRGHRLADLQLDLGLDPLGALAATGDRAASWDAAAWRCAEALTALNERGFAGRAFLADGRPYHEAGAGEAQELAAVLATGLHYLRALTEGGHDLETARDALAFLMVADADEFLTVAKFRALRRLWARVEEACGLAPRPIRLHAETAWRMTSRRDPWVNMLRATVATFSAGVGGADAVTVLPFTAALGLPDAFARRVARNTQTVLLDESNLWRVADPAAGAGGFEALTEGLVERAWAGFQEIEREGGMLASLTRGAVQERIAATREAREKAIARRKEPLTGVSEFPDIREAPVAVLMPAPAPAVAAGSAGVEPAGSPEEAGRLADLLATAASGAALAGPVCTGAPAVMPLPSVRLAQSFEALRDRSDAVLADTGTRPKVFLANLGPIAAFTGRATYAKNFFEAGGIEAVTNDGFPDLDALTAAYRASGAPLACLCSSDEVYAEQAVAAAQALKAAGCGTLYLAGKPGELEGALEEAGIGGFIFVGCDVLATLDAAYRQL